MQGQFNTPEFKLFSEFEEGQGGGGESTSEFSCLSETVP